MSHKTWRLPAIACSFFVFDDNEAVIKMIIRGRSSSMRHVSRTCLVDLHWLLERVNWDWDSAISMRYVNTQKRIADILMKGSFYVEENL